MKVIQGGANKGKPTRQDYEGKIQGLNEELEAAYLLIASLQDGYREIREHYGHVCDDYELCNHTSCQSSSSSWTIADQKLSQDISSATSLVSSVMQAAENVASKWSHPDMGDLIALRDAVRAYKGHKE